MKKTPLLKSIVILIPYLTILRWLVFLIKSYLGTNLIWDKNNTPNTSTWIAISWSIYWQFEKVITEDFIIDGTRTIFKYPQIIIKKPIKNVYLQIDVEFSDEFKSMYSYKNSDDYFFALKFFIWDFNNWWYFSVIRNSNWWVNNSKDDQLIWAKSAKEINLGTSWYIPLNDTVPIAKENWNYWYEFMNSKLILDQSINKPLYIGAYLSSTKFQQWWEFTKIKKMKLIYEWYENSIDTINK